MSRRSASRVMAFACCAFAVWSTPALAQHEGHSAERQRIPLTVETPPSSSTKQTVPAKVADAGATEQAPREPIPPITEADRAIAFPPVHAHHKHGTSIQNYWLLDRLETLGRGNGAWEGMAWIGGDVQKLWLRTEGQVGKSNVESGSVDVLYGRGISAWWDVVAGVRHDFGDGPDRNWVAIGVQGLAPYKFETSLTGYLGANGRTALGAEAEYDTLLTNRLILQWRGEAMAFGKADPARGIGSGLSTASAGARLRYEIRRQFAPYIGVEHERAFGQTARLRRDVGHAAGETRIVAGVRIWF